MFIELRHYRVKPGQRDRWVAFMEEKIIYKAKIKSRNPSRPVSANICKGS